MLARLLLAAVVAAIGSPHGIAVHVERVARSRVDFDVVYPHGQPDRFVGYADHGRPTWLTTCFVREFYGKLCGTPPADAAQEPLPRWILPARFAHPLDPGLVRPEALAVAKDGSVLILDSFREELFARAPDGSLRALTPTTASAIAVAPDGAVYLADGARVRVLGHGTLRRRFGQVRSLAFAPNGTLFVGTSADVVEADGRVVVHGAGPFSPDGIAVGGDHRLYVYSSGSKQIFEFTLRGKKLHAWTAYANGLATAPDGSVVVGTQGGALFRIHDGKLSTIADFGEGRPFGFPFQPDGVAVGLGGTIYADTFVGNGYTNQTALAAVTPGGHAHLLRTTTPLSRTLPPGMTTGCPSPDGLRSFDAAATKAAIRAAQVVDIPPFARGLRLSDPSWWAGFYADQIDGRYQIGRHHVHAAAPASADPYSGAVSKRCGAALVRDSLAIVVGHGVYSDQVSHMFFLDRDGRALLYWQHT